MTFSCNSGACRGQFRQPNELLRHQSEVHGRRPGAIEAEPPRLPQRPAQCSGYNNVGSRCRNNVMRGSDLCAAHWWQAADEPEAAVSR